MTGFVRELVFIRENALNYGAACSHDGLDNLIHVVCTCTSCTISITQYNLNSLDQLPILDHEFHPVRLACQSHRHARSYHSDLKRNNQIMHIQNFFLQILYTQHVIVNVCKFRADHEQLSTHICRAVLMSVSWP